MSDEQQTIIYTLTDEAPLLATYAFLPVVRAFLAPAGIDVKASDISVAARILAEYEPIVMLRAGWRGPDWAALEAIHPDAHRLAHVVEVPLLDVAAHDLRDRVRSGRSVRYLVPERVRQFIEDNALYCLDA